MNWFKKNIHILILLFIGLIFFHVYTFLYHDTSYFTSLAPEQEPWIIFNQPDEGINYYFIRNLVEYGSTTVYEPLSFLSLDQVHPRSVTVHEDYLAPIGFPGFIVFSSVVTKLLVSGISFNSIVLGITPMLAIVTPLLLFGALRFVWGRQVAFLSALLLFMLPPWWYYASRPLQHNVAFVFFLILSLYLLTVWLRTRSVPWKRYVSLALAAGSMAFTLYIRPVEAVWVILLAMILLMVLKRYWKWKDLFAAGIAVACVALLFFLTQTIYYGHPLASGYVAPENGASGLIHEDPQGIPSWQVLIAPFGFHPKTMLKNAWYYFVLLSPVWSIGIGGGLVFLLIRIWMYHRNTSVTWWKNITSLKKLFRERHVKIIIRYVLLWLLISGYLLIYYGSWGFFDNVQGLSSLASSHVRYFLPIYVGALPFVAYGLYWIARKLQKPHIVYPFVFILFLFFSRHVVFASFEGLKHVKHTVKEYAASGQRFYEYLPQDAVVVTRYGDKYIFPGRDVIPGFIDPQAKEAVVRLLHHDVAVYWIGTYHEYDDISTQEFILSDTITVSDGVTLRQIRLPQEELEEEADVH